MRSRILLGTVFGAIGGFLGFLLQEFLVPHNVGSMTTQDLTRLGMFVGGMIGLGIGAVEGAATNSPRLLARGTLIGLMIGAVGGIAGAYVGGVIYNYALFGKDPDVLEQSRNILDFTHAVLARALGWTFMGAFPGLAAGAATLSSKRALHGLAGGLLGGFVGGVLFNLVAKVIATPVVTVTSAASGGPKVIEVGGMSRAIGFTLIGLLTGLFIGLVEELLKQAWVRVLAGKNEGKDYIISKPMTVLGRDERADVPLFGDPSLAPQHSAIKLESNRHFLLDGGTPVGSVVNGQRIQGQQILRDGDMIQLGQVRLLFREKATASKIGRPVADAPKTAAQAPGAVSMPSHLCPYCGAAKDAQGNCQCSVPGAGLGAGAGYAAPTGPGPATGPLGATPGFSPNFGDPMGYGGEPTMGSGFGQPAYGGVAVGSGAGSRLTAIDGPYAGQAFSIAPGVTTVGRSPENGVPLPNDSTVSRRHAHISEENGQHVIYDDGSSNGTFVNRVRISIQALAPGDVVQFGSSSFRYE